MQCDPSCQKPPKHSWRWLCGPVSRLCVGQQRRCAQLILQRGKSSLCQSQGEKGDFFFFWTSFGVLISIFGNVYPLLWSIAREGRWLRVWWKQDLNSCSKVFFFIPPLSCFGSLLWSVFSSLLLLDLVPILMCSRGKHVSKGTCLNAGKCIIAVTASNLGFFFYSCFV